MRGGSQPGTWVIDLDGVVWLAEDPIPGSAEAVSELRRAGYGVIFATNNAAPTNGELMQRLARAGIRAEPWELVTSAHAAASMLRAGERALVCADQGVLEALEERGVSVVVPRGDATGDVDAVVVGWTRKFDFERLAEAASAVRAGARLIGTNEDATHPTPRGLLPGSGALLAAVAAAAQCEPEVAGKPHEPMVGLLRERASKIGNGSIEIVVGDRPSTDGRLAELLEVPFGFVHSDVTGDGREVMVVTPEFEADDLAALVRRLVAP